MADVKAEVKVKTLGEMTGDLKKRALVGNGSQNKKIGGRDFFFQTLSDVTDKALVYTLTDTIACTGGAPVDTLA